MRIYLLRHGETSDNVAGRYSGSGNASLTDHGVAQVQAAAIRLKDAGITHLWSSPSPRAMQSAGIAAPNLIPIQDDRLREHDMGDFEGLTYKDVRERYPQEAKAWEKDWMHFEMPGGESYLQFYTRVESFWRDLLGWDELPKPGTPQIPPLEESDILLLSTHGGVVRASLSLAMGDPSLFWKFACPNGALASVEYAYGDLYMESLWPGHV